MSESRETTIEDGMKAITEFTLGATWLIVTGVWIYFIVRYGLTVWKISSLDEVPAQLFDASWYWYIRVIFAGVIWVAVSDAIKWLGDIWINKA